MGQTDVKTTGGSRRCLFRGCTLEQHLRHRILWAEWCCSHISPPGGRRGVDREPPVCAEVTVMETVACPGVPHSLTATGEGHATQVRWPLHVDQDLTFNLKSKNIQHFHHHPPSSTSQLCHVLVPVQPWGRLWLRRIHHLQNQMYSCINSRVLHVHQVITAGTTDTQVPCSSSLPALHPHSTR